MPGYWVVFLGVLDFHILPSSVYILIPRIRSIYVCLSLFFFSWMGVSEGQLGVSHAKGYSFHTGRYIFVVSPTFPPASVYLASVRSTPMAIGHWEDWKMGVMCCAFSPKISVRYCIGLANSDR